MYVYEHVYAPARALTQTHAQTSTYTYIQFIIEHYSHSAIACFFGSVCQFSILIEYDRHTRAHFDSSLF